MSAPNEIVDITMFGCPMHRIKALQAAKTLESSADAMKIAVNNDALKIIVEHLEEHGFQCSYVESDSLTSVITVKKHV